MGGVLEQFQGRTRAEGLAECYDLLRLGEGVARALHKQHGDLHVEKMLAAFLRGTSRGMQGKAEEREPANAGKRNRGLGLGRHAAAERFSAGEERKRG